MRSLRLDPHMHLRLDEDARNLKRNLLFELNWLEHYYSGLASLV